MQATIVLRQSPDWGALDYGFLRHTGAFERMAGLPDRFVSDLIREWDRTFAVSYFSVRQRMKDLSLANLRSVSDAQVVDMDRFYREMPRAELYLFTDDDDWFCPDIVRLLLEHDADGIEGFVWRSVRFSGSLDVREREHCFTNNYAVTYRFDRSAMRSVDQHFAANAVFFGPRTEHFARVPRLLSIANKHPCSPSVLFNTYRRNPDREMLTEFLAHFNAEAEACRLQGHLEWAAPYVMEIGRLFREVARSAGIRGN